MRLAAIYFEPGEDLKHLFEKDKPQTINFGGRYFYTFEKKDGTDILVTRKSNENFIPDFFNLDDELKTVTNLNAIVGQNGAGKSTICKIIRSCFNNELYKESRKLFLFEQGENLIYCTKKFGSVKMHNNNELEKVDEVNSLMSFIYYSPHFDYKYFDTDYLPDSHDISNDATSLRDFEELRFKDDFGNSGLYNPSHELLFKNSLRQWKLLKSDLKPIINLVLPLQDISKDNTILYFRGYKGNLMESIDESFDSLRTILNKNHIEFAVKNPLKLRIIENIISCIYVMMKKNFNDLSKIDLPKSVKTEIDGSDADKAILLFIKNYKIGKQKLFAHNYLVDLIQKIYDAIEEHNNDGQTETKEFVNYEFLRTTSENSDEIVKLHENFINDFIENCYKLQDNNKKEPYTIDGFINYKPLDNKLSSGEIALLNLFSRIYDLFNNSLKTTHDINLKDHYILLLDEADLTFHPKWKKKYVKALLTALPHIFNKVKTKPTFQIIFTTHDPLSLSDLPNPNVVYIERENYDSKVNIMDNDNRPPKTFGANISDLLADSFFVEDSLIGDFAKDKINKIIDWLNDKDKKIDENDYHKKLISLIDEPIVQRKLAEMYDEKMDENIQVKIINDQIKKLEKLKSKLENDALPKSKK